MNQRGFALVESLATLTFAAAALTGGAGLSYAAFARMYLKRAAYEGSICLTTPAPTRQCERTFRNDIAHALPVGELRGLYFTPLSDHVEVNGSFVIPGGVTIPIHDSRKIHLLESSTPEALKRRFP